jgi:hypothetical protein
MSEEIFPYGKFQGKPIRELIDPSNNEFKKYLEWNKGNRPDFYEKIIKVLEKYEVNNINIYYNNTGNTDSPTPEHNVLQNKFFKEDVCLKLFDIYYSKFHNKLKEYIKLVKEHEDSKYFDISDKVFESSYFDYPVKTSIANIDFEYKFNWDVFIPYVNDFIINFNIKKEFYDEDIKNFTAHLIRT